MLEDYIDCPICGDKLRTVRKNKITLYFVNKTAKYIERLCTKGYAHSLQLFYDINTGKIDLLKFSLSHKYDSFIELDFVNLKSRIIYFNSDNSPEYININALIMPDFPDLVGLKEKVSKYRLFS